MISVILSRLWQSLLVLLAVALIAFCMFQYLGDPVVFMLGQDASPEQIRQLRTDMGLDRPFWVQFAHFVTQAAQGEFGLSLRQGMRVSSLIAERLPATLELALVAAALSLLLGIPLGIYTAVRRDSALARAAMVVSLLGVSLPTFLTGMLLILGFSVGLGVMPSFGRGDTVQIGPWATGLLTPSGWSHIVLPAATLAAFQLALLLRLVRAEMLEILRSDYIRFARARGIAERSITLRHALRNTLVPVITVAALQIGTLVAFSIITETVFQWPGLGLLFVQSVVFADIPVMAAYLCVVSVVFVASNLLADLLYVVVDPRLRAGH